MDDAAPPHDASATSPRDPWRPPRPSWPQLLSSPLRCLPDFLIIGAQKAGTTSLFASLNEHPSVWMPPCKECHFFTRPWRPMLAYRGFFPTRRTRDRMGRDGEPVRLGEATPYYLFHPRTPARVARSLPEVKLIAILRDPVERAYSHHRHCVRRGTESLDFEAALEAEATRTAGAAERLARSAFAVSDAHRHHSYLARGLYAQQLRRWFEHVDRRRIHVAFFEHLLESPETSLARIETFLGLPVRDRGELPRRNSGGRSAPMADETRRRLRERFAEPNRELAELLGVEPPWPAS
jgi:hypothetical protein